MRDVFFILLLLSISSVRAQERIDWVAHYDATSKQINIDATIATGWHIYSQFIDPEVGPVPTTIEFEKNAAVQFKGKPSEPKTIVAFDESFGAEVAYLESKPRFSQQIATNSNTSVIAHISYMMCNQNTCLPPTEKIIRIEVYP
jgi:thiol:disulfide interchange protein DsbD